MSDLCEYCGQEERYGHNAVCVMNEVIELRAENERLRAPFSACDGKDWDYILDKIGWGGRDRFWKEVLTAARAAHTTSQRAEK